MIFFAILFASFLIFGCQGQTTTLTFTNTYPQNFYVATYCTNNGYTFISYICNGGQYGPYTTNDFLESNGQCSCCCDCNSVTVTCDGLPSGSPIYTPSIGPNFFPSIQPVYIPTIMPKYSPTYIPTIYPTCNPSAVPTYIPTKIPSLLPSALPTQCPTTVPTATPSFVPSTIPTVTPSIVPTTIPTATPSFVPTTIPTYRPTCTPSVTPTFIPTFNPTFLPSSQPSAKPSKQPRKYPSSQPIQMPSGQPSKQPNTAPSCRPSSQPIFQPSYQPSMQPLFAPTVQPLEQPSKQPIFKPSIQPYQQPTGQPSKQPSVRPSSRPTMVPSFKPSSNPSLLPSSLPFTTPSVQPSRRPSKQPNSNPSKQPIQQPSLQPLNFPSLQPTLVPSLKPFKQPTAPPSRKPSLRPSRQPLFRPLGQPSLQPFRQPTSQPSIQPSFQPAIGPSAQPLRQPSLLPSDSPTSQPIYHPSMQPSHQPTELPSKQPTMQPTSQPVSNPTSQPTHFPSSKPSLQPAELPTVQPTAQPLCKPSKLPSAQPKLQPTFQPSSKPTTNPSVQPTFQPIVLPTRQPRSQPTIQPSTKPTLQPSITPSSQPSSKPTHQPFKRPSKQPSRKPSRTPSKQPSTQPSTEPSLQPSAQPTMRPSFMPSVQPSFQPSMQPSSQPSGQPKFSPSQQPSAEPSFQPSIQPSSQPIRRPSLQPSTQPSFHPSIQPLNYPSCQPTVLPSFQPSDTPTFMPSLQPSAQPTMQPSSTPSIQPSFQPSMQPSSQPSGQPKISPSRQPSAEPSFQPSIQPSSQPIRRPSVQPSSQPLNQPTIQPTFQPTRRPTKKPSAQPSTEPSSPPSTQPSVQPKMFPSFQPTIQPSRKPSIQPSSQPSHQPKQLPSEQPSAQPSSRPSIQPSYQPMVDPSSNPTVQPSSNPSIQPSIQPSLHPVVLPSKDPSVQPSYQPSSQPSSQPTVNPTSQPSIQPSSQPTVQPSAQPSLNPTRIPSTQPSKQPSSQPSSLPSIQPNIRPSFQPSIVPSLKPSARPSTIPSRQPTSQPLKQPSMGPSIQPSVQPWTMPSIQPLLLPTTQPSPLPSRQPLSNPSVQPSSWPSSMPSFQPFVQPTEFPSICPSVHPSVQPTSEPSHYPSMQPSGSPSIKPSKEPSLQPSFTPSLQPQFHPSFQPISFPSLQPQRHPTTQPFVMPTDKPSSTPTTRPSFQPNTGPSSKPSIQPVFQPTLRPSQQPLGGIPSQQPSVKPSFKPLIAPTICPICCPSSQPFGKPSSNPSSQPLLGTPTSQPRRNPSKQPTSQPQKRPRSKPTSQPLKSPSRQPSRRPISRPSGHPSRSPISYPSTSPSSLPNRRPTAQPNREPTSSPTAKSKKPINVNIRVPTVLSTISPTRSISEELNNQVRKVISDLTNSSISSSEKYSVYQQIQMNGVSQSSNCNGWAAFIQNGFVLLQSTYLPRSISLVAIHQKIHLSSIFSNVKYVCEDRAAVKFLVNAIATSAWLGQGKMMSRTCSGNSWTVYSCSSDMTVPLSLCVNCMNPCSPLPRSVAISSCSGNLSTSVQNDPLFYAQVLSVGYVGLFQPPKFTMVNITSSRSTVTVSATMSSAGEMVCAVFLSTAAAPTSYDEIQVQSYISYSNSRNETSVLMTGLQAITQYKVYCFTSSYGVKTALSTVIANYFLTSTKCCKYLSVHQSLSSLLEGVNSLNFLSMVLSAYPTDSVGIEISLKQLNNTSGSAKFFPNSFEIHGGTSVSSLQLVSSLSKLSVGSYSYSIQLSGSSADEYEVVYLSGRNPVFTVITVDSIQPAPSLISAVFSDDGSSFTMLFDSATNRGSTTTVFNCAQLFEFSCARQSQCQWLDSQHVISYVFGSSSCASPGAIMRISSQAAIKAPCLAVGRRCPSYSSWRYVTRSAVRIGGPVAGIAPQIVLSLPAVVGSCDSLTIDISSSTGSGGRPWKEARITVRRSDDGNISSLLSYLNATFKASPPTVVPSALIQRGFSYTFSIYLCNFLGMCNQASQVVAALETVIPTALLPGQPIRTTTRNSLVTIASVASVSICSGENSKLYSLQYSWAITQNGIPLLGMTSVSNDPSKFLLAPYSLSSNAFYTIQVTVTIKGSLKSAAASCVLFVAVGKVVSVVSGEVRSSISIDASKSYDEDVKGLTGTAAGLLFDWSCVQISPFLNNTCLNTLAWSYSDSSAPVVTFASLASSAGTQSIVTVVVKDSSGSRRSSSSVTVTVVSVSAPIVSSSSSALNGVMNPGQTLQLLGSVIFPDVSLRVDPVVRWSVSDSSVNLTAVSLTPVSATLKAVSSNVYLVVAPSTLPVGSVLTFTLSCCGDGSLPLYSSSVTITINSPPRAGFLQLNPNPGIELQDNFLFSTGQWTDIDLPMQYQFGYISPQGATVITLSKSLKAYGTSLLPAGSDSMNNILGTFVVVFDALNANSFLSYSVVVNHGSTQTNSLEMISAVVSNSGNLSTASVDQVKQFNGLVTYLMSKANCSLSPDCSLLHRRECSSTPHTCGSCTSDLYTGESGDSNSMCVLKSLLGSPSTITSKCVSDFQCSGFQRCVRASCAVSQKVCNSNCSGHGECMFINSNTGAVISTCTIDDPSCVTQCACEPAYVESLYCAWNISEMQARQTIKSQVFKNIEHLTSVEYPDTDSVSGWISTLASASSQVDEFSDGSVDSVLRVSSLVLQSAQGVGLGNDALLGLASSLSSAILFAQKKSGNMHQRRLFARHLMSATNTSTSSVEVALDHLRQFGLVMAGNMLPGQAAVESVQSEFRLSATVVPSFEGGESSRNTVMAVEVPQSALEIGTRQAQAVVSVPLDNSTTAGDSYLHMASISMPSSFSGDSLQANPVIVYLSRLPCLSSSTACDIQFTLPAATPILRNVTNVNETASVHCYAGFRSDSNYTCANGYVLNFTCSGEFVGGIHQRCPTVRYNSSCHLLNSRLAVEDGAQCRVVAQSESSTICQCSLMTSSTPIQGNLGARRHLLEYSNNSTQGIHSIAVSTLLVVVASGIESTIVSAVELSLDVITKEVTVLVTMAVLAVSIIFFISFSKYLDYKDELSEKEYIVVDESLSVKLMSTSITARRSDRKKQRGGVGKQELAMLEESLPSIFSSQKFAVKLTSELKRNHKWFGVIFHHSKVFPRVLRAMALSTNIILMLFVQSMTYNLTNPDDGSCEMLESQEACRQPKSSFGTGGSKCLWTQQGSSAEGSCHFIQPSTDLTVILFVACFSALVTTPFSLVLNWLIFRVLAAPTYKAPGPQDMAGHTMNKSETNPKEIEAALGHDHARNSLRRQELEQLSKGLQSYRELLSAQQRDEFDKLWGLSSDGTFQSDRRSQSGVSKSQKGKKDVAEVLLSELAVVADTVEKERKRIDAMAIRKEKQRRLLFLFQKDLLPGVSGQILHSKAHREDVQVHGAASALSKAIVYLLILSSNAAMLFYVFLFAMGQTKFRQDAWFRSFVIWISMEIFVVGTVIVLLTHVVLPSLIMPDIAKIKEKLVDSIRDYQKDLKNKTEEEKADAGEKLFNSAEFFFASSKLAKFYMDLPVAKIISKFSTPWPRQSYQHVVDVSRRYDRRFSGLSSSVGIVLLFFVGSFLSIPLGMQDGLLHSLFTVAVGYLVLLHIQLYNVQPALAFIPLFTICTVAHFIILSYRKRTRAISEVTPMMDEQQNNNSKPLVTRRDSILAGLDVAAVAHNYLDDPDHVSDSDVPISLGSISMNSSDIEILSDNSDENIHLHHDKRMKEEEEEDKINAYGFSEVGDVQSLDSIVYYHSIEDSDGVDQGNSSIDYSY